MNKKNISLSFIGWFFKLFSGRRRFVYIKIRSGEKDPWVLCSVLCTWMDTVEENETPVCMEGIQTWTLWREKKVIKPGW